MIGPVIGEPAPTTYVPAGTRISAYLAVPLAVQELAPLQRPVLVLNTPANNSLKFEELLIVTRTVPKPPVNIQSFPVSLPLVTSTFCGERPPVSGDQPPI